MANPRQLDIQSILNILSDRKWSQKDLSEKSGIGEDLISEWMTGKTSPNAKSIRKLVNTLNVNTEDILLHDPNKLNNAISDTFADAFSWVQDIKDGVDEDELENINNALCALSSICSNIDIAEIQLTTKVVKEQEEPTESTENNADISDLEARMEEVLNDEQE